MAFSNALAGQDVPRALAPPNHVHDQLAGPAAAVFLARVDSRRARPSRAARDPMNSIAMAMVLAVKLPAAGARAGAGVVLEVAQVLFAHLAGGMAPIAS